MTIECPHCFTLFQKEDAKSYPTKTVFNNHWKSKTALEYLESLDDVEEEELPQFEDIENNS